MKTRLMILFILLIFFLGCSSNGALLRRIDALENKVEELHTLDSNNTVTADFPDDTEMWDEEVEKFNLENIVQRLFCAQCKKEGLSSTIQRGMSTRTVMGTHEYWDEDGKHHYNDPNYTTTGWICSQGHEWITSE